MAVVVAVFVVSWWQRWSGPKRYTHPCRRGIADFRSCRLRAMPPATENLSVLCRSRLHDDASCSLRLTDDLGRSGRRPLPSVRVETLLTLKLPGNL